MDKARQIISDILVHAEAPALLWSGGKDSQLLLSLIREVYDIPLIWFRTGADESFQRAEILASDLTVWSWGASDTYLIPNGEEFSLIKEHAFGEHRLPVLTDLGQGERCVFDLHDTRTPELFPHFDALFIGYRDSDFHPALGHNYCPSDGWELGKAKVYAPLRHLTDSGVWSEVERRGLRTAPSTDIKACTLCLHGEPVMCPKVNKVIEIDWNPDLSLQTFKQRFGLEVAHA